MFLPCSYMLPAAVSPSMRREWIEILDAVRHADALGMSPSMRREWIEMNLSPSPQLGQYCLPPCGGSGLK